MRIDGRTDTPTGRIFHVENKRQLSVWLIGLNAALKPPEGLIDKAKQKIAIGATQAVLNTLKVDTKWFTGTDVDKDKNAILLNRCFCELTAYLEGRQFPLNVRVLLFYILNLFHNDEMYREKGGWLIEQVKQRYNPQWTDEEVVAFLATLKGEWKSMDKRTNRHYHIGMCFDGAIEACRQFPEVMGAFRYFCDFWKSDKAWLHEPMYEPPNWYPHRGLVHYAIHGGSV